MNSKSIFSFLLFGIFISCSSQNKVNEKPMKNDNRMIYEIDSTMLPITIKFGAIGKGSTLPPTIFKITGDSILITSKNRRVITGLNKYSINIKTTKFAKLFSNIPKGDFEGDKHYYHEFVRDGGYMEISTKYGKRKFSNTFFKEVDRSKIKPDTLNLSKFEAISNYSLLLLRDLEI